ncbi:trypsin-like peptidase domain-containing protein [Candidatus Odyssella thessalonicensis]|uniref:trypsin-like peptidase domain-containing protein n=1 Tax=Candidatus Odyssella thessalonicensis TaxID=84647 RepID=UPI000225AEC7|nr:trypsin-like peptidase domain-containing protein [Candidatus Odyssella thessalonicensis]
MCRFLFLIVASFHLLFAACEATKAPESVDEVKLSFSPVVKKVAPAIVSIYALQVIEHKFHPLFNDDFFSNFFDHPQGPIRQELGRSMGSGVIVSKDGIVVTCAHVVQNAKLIEIKLSDNRSLQGKVIVTDEKNDLAIIQLLKTHGDIPFIPLGQSSHVEDGDLVLAFGNPFGIGHTVTSGIISRATRMVGGRVLMQTDSAINPGNSGGALVNMKGELIGIPNAILSKTGTNLGIGFAIPVSMVMPLLSSKSTNGRVVRAWDGIKVATLSPEKAESFGMKDGKGVLVTAIHDNSPAKKAGLQVSDVITKVNAMAIESEETYLLKILETNPDQDLSYSVKRKGEEKTINFKTIAPPELPKAEETLIQGNNPLSGLKIANLSPALALKYSFDMMQTGVVILESPPSQSLFGLSLFEPGDIIVEADGEKVTSVKHFAQLASDGLKSLVLRRGTNQININIGSR